MLNLAMQRKLENERCIDVKDCEREGDYYVLEEFVDDVDYCDSTTETWIWSIGKRHSDGKILASTQGDLYQNPDFECLWLR